MHNPTPPVIAFSAWSGTGKTTIIEQLIPEFKCRGLRVAVIKHDPHKFEIDQEGKDSWRFTRAGADIAILNSKEKTALIEQRSLDLAEALSLIHDVDLVLAEGYQQEELPKIGISRKATGKGFRLPLSEYIAVITDEDLSSLPYIPSNSSSTSSDKNSPQIPPAFSLESIPEIADFILHFCSYSETCDSE